jgi:predicted nucleic acid-binding protein
MILTLVDTDVLIDASHQHLHAQSALARAQQQGLLAISVMTEMELLSGCRNKTENAAVERILNY